MGDPWMYLITGPEKALLIDTSFGIGDLRGLVDEITGGMPTIVVNTHASVDHSYGNFQFEKVYCHEYAVPYLQKQMDPTFGTTSSTKRATGFGPISTGTISSRSKSMR